MLRRLKVRVSDGYGVCIGFFKSEKLKKTLEVEIVLEFYCGFIIYNFGF